MEYYVFGRTGIRPDTLFLGTLTRDEQSIDADRGIMPIGPAVACALPPRAGT